MVGALLVAMSYRATGYRATGPQIAYLRRLIDRAHMLGITTGYDRHHLERVTKVEASGAISRLKDEVARAEAAR